MILQSTESTFVTCKFVEKKSILAAKSVTISLQFLLHISDVMLSRDVDSKWINWYNFY